MLNKIKGSIKYFYALQKHFASKRDLKNFLLSYGILRNDWLRKTIVKLSQWKIGKSAALTKIFNEHQLNVPLTTLKKEGYLFLNKTISDDIISNIKKQTDGLLCSDPYHPEVGLFPLEKIPAEVNIAGYQPKDLIKIPEIMCIANDQEILAIVQEYFGCKPTITGVEMWWSLTDRKTPQFAQLYHRDFDGIKFLKLFVYLTDVDQDNGPHVYIPGTVNLKQWRRPTRFSDEQIARLFSDKIKPMCGKKGMMFLEDTFGIHKGSLPIANHRLLLQIQYGITPLVYADYQPSQLTYREYDSYVNRLFLASN